MIRFLIIIRLLLIGLRCLANQRNIDKLPYQPRKALKYVQTSLSQLGKRTATPVNNEGSKIKVEQINYAPHKSFRCRHDSMRSFFWLLTQSWEN